MRVVYRHPCCYRWFVFSNLLAGLNLTWPPILCSLLPVDQGNQDTDRITTPPEPVVGIDVIDLRLKQELQSLRAEIEAFLKNPEPHTWDPPDCPTRSEKEFLQNLHLPCDRSGRPSLLLHDLDACDGDEIEKLFEPDQHMYVVIMCALNPSHHRLQGHLQHLWIRKNAAHSRKSH
jgi:hypothetical protein